ncbi:MAG: hypothetical protein M3R70_03060 [Actinomycetota bacterium]|nr:hypothetical protein [Actinomycetota bacterium]
MYAQTVVLTGNTTDFGVLCQECARRQPDAQPRTFFVEGTLRRYADLGWTHCPRGHRIRAIRAGRDVHAELTTPLWH